MYSSLLPMIIVPCSRSGEHETARDLCFIGNRPLHEDLILHYTSYEACIILGGNTELQWI